MERLLTAAVLSATGGFLAFGARRGWKWLVDPPTGSAWVFYSQSVLKMLFGPRAPLVFAYACGALLVAAGIAVLLSPS